MSKTFDVIILGNSGPKTRLTAEEADRIACVLFIDHNHEANKPQPALFWHRLPDGDYGQTH